MMKGKGEVEPGDELKAQARDLLARLQNEKQLLESENLQPGNLRGVKIRRGKLERQVEDLRRACMHARSYITDLEYIELGHLFNTIERRSKLNDKILNQPDMSQMSVEGIANSSAAINPAVVVKDGIVVGTWMGSSRPRTNIGPQGDHVTAFALIKDLAVQITKGMKLDDAIMVMMFIIDHHAYDNVQDPVTIDAIQNIFDRVKYMQQTGMSEEEIALTVSCVPSELQEKVLATLQRGNQSLLADICNQLIAHFITQRNKRAHTAYPTQGNMLPPEGESTRIYNALNYLNELTEESFDLSRVVHAIRNTFWFPRVSDGVMLSEDSAEWAAVSSRFNTGTLPRSNELDILKRVLTTHLQTILDTFPSCQNTEVVVAFIESVIRDPEGASINFNWNLNDEERVDVLQTVCREIGFQFVLETPSVETAEGMPTSFSSSVRP